MPLLYAIAFACMGSAVRTIILLLLLGTVDLGSPAPLIIGTIKVNFTASNFHNIDQSGDFLQSLNGIFKATIDNDSQDSSADYYFSLKHIASNAVVWSANPANPISSSTLLSFTPRGLSLSDPGSTTLIWSTPALSSPASALRLLDSGNLLLLSSSGAVLWQSFDHPSDTLLPAQRLGVGKSLSTPLGDYRLWVTPADAVLQWNGSTYWKLSMQTQAYKDSNLPVSFLAVNSTGLYLLAGDNSTAVIKLTFNATGESPFTALRLGRDGRVSVDRQLSVPGEQCQLPFACAGLGLCDSSFSSCSCPAGFVQKSNSDYYCSPTNRSLTLPPASGCSNESLSVSYLKLGNDTDYFANSFSDPVQEGLDLSACQGLCSRSCSCLALFHHSPSGSCFLLSTRLGSLRRIDNGSRAGYVKVLASPPGRRSSRRRGFPLAALVLLPAATVSLLVAGAALLLAAWARRKRGRLERWNSSSASSEGEIAIPGLPVRFGYKEVAEATEDFKHPIGSGGFGTVYRGTLGDGSAVAVKRISNLGVRGKKDFFSEITIIGSIHHLNLVRLRGFCAQGRQRFLVLELMSRGSLDSVLFGGGAAAGAVGWKERMEIALGAGRGLAYLHSGCDHKIIHCDVKPENILLHHHPPQVKISDFGLSKLLSPEQSSLFTTMRGTRGYLAPEWLTSSSISDKADVYSYGMVLLEIVRGRKNSDTDKGSAVSSASSASGYFPLVALEMHERGRYSELADPRLEGRVAEEEVEKAVKIALCCVHEDPGLRPSMGTVVGMLEGAIPVAEPRVESLNFLRFYGQRFTEASQNVELSNPNQEFVMWKSGTSSSYASSSYMSSHQLSGPR